MRSKEQLEKLQQEMKARIIAEKERKGKPQPHEEPTLHEVLVKKVEPTPPPTTSRYERTVCISCKHRIARIGSPYCSRCTSKGFMNGLRDTLPGTVKPMFQIWAMYNGGTKLVGEAETLQEAVNYYRQNERSQLLFGIKYPNGKWHRFEEAKCTQDQSQIVTESLDNGKKVADPVTSVDQPTLFGDCGSHETEPTKTNNTNVETVSIVGGSKELTPNSYTRAQVARLLGVSPTTLMRWERKGYIPQPERVGGSAISPGGTVYTEELVEAAKKFMSTQYHPEQAHTPAQDGTIQVLPRVVKKSIKLNRGLEKAVGRLLR